MSKPEAVFKVGAVRAAVFRNAVERAGKQVLMPKVSLEVRYRDQNGQWKGTGSLSLNDIPKAMLALQKVYDYLTANKSGESQKATDSETVESSEQGPPQSLN